MERVAFDGAMLEGKGVVWKINARRHDARELLVHINRLDHETVPVEHAHHHLVGVHVSFPPPDVIPFREDEELIVDGDASLKGSILTPNCLPPSTTFAS